MDILLFYDAERGADFRLRGRDLLGDDSLYTAVLVSLFTDARATSTDELPPEMQQENDLRGFWGDAVMDDTPSLGSKLWLLHREKQMPVVLRRAEQYATEALQWLLRDGLATAVVVTASVPKPERLGLAVCITLPSLPGAPARTEAWNFTLSGTEA